MGIQSHYFQPDTDIRQFLLHNHVEASAPARIDFGGTTDISTLYYPLSHIAPVTFNMAISLRTTVRLYPCEPGMIRICANGVGEEMFPLEKAPFSHPLGLMNVICYYFRAHGVHVEIDSASPPKSALGGSSAAAVALVAAFSKALASMDGSGGPARKKGRNRDGFFPGTKEETAILAHALEESVASVPCGMQDQLAAATGGANLWQWHPKTTDTPPFSIVFSLSDEQAKALENHILLAYCGIPHESANINSRWVKGFLSGQYRKEWEEISRITREFAYAVSCPDIEKAVRLMKKELDIRLSMTPDVLDAMGYALLESAEKERCAARFTGAGGGGCVWALGQKEDIDRLKNLWEEILKTEKEAKIIQHQIDTRGVFSTTRAREAMEEK